MSFKTILVPTEQNDLMSTTLEAALLLGRTFDSYIEGFALRRAVVDVYAMEVGGAFPMAELAESDAEISKQARGAFEGFMSAHSVAQAQPDSGGLGFGWLDDAPVGDEFVGSYGRVFDLTVLGKPGSKAQSPRMMTLEASLFESGRPVLVVPPTAPQHIGENILIAWNRSTEQARANFFAIPLLRRAKKVTAITVEGGAVMGPSGEQLVRYLKRNGIAVEHRNISLNDKGAGEVILAQAEALGCDLIVKGAYTQSRLRQMIFGGATRHILTHTTLPVFMAH